MKRLLLATTLLVATSMFVLACGSDDKGGDGTATATGSATASGSPTGDGTAVVSTPRPAGTQVAPRTVSPEEGTRIAGDITGGGPDSTPQVIGTPIVVGGATPVVDPTEIADAEPDASGLEFIVDMNASQPGIQATRDVNPGDTFKVAIVAMNVPPNQLNTGGITAFNFTIDYDKTKIVAPTITGGSATERNPDLNVPELGGDAAGWDCLPAPEGDLDDPGGIMGDGNPETGQAFLSCFTVGAKESGTLTLAVVTFTAIAGGSSNVSLSNLSVGDIIGLNVASCEGDASEPFVPCRDGTANVR